MPLPRARRRAADGAALAPPSRSAQTERDASLGAFAPRNDDASKTHALSHLVVCLRRFGPLMGLVLEIFERLHLEAKAMAVVIQLVERNRPTEQILAKVRRRVVGGWMRSGGE